MNQVEQKTKHRANPNRTGGVGRIGGSNESVPAHRHEIDDRYNAHDASFRRHYQLNYSDSGHDYDDFYAPAYRFGYELAEENGTTNWAACIDRAQTHWQSQHTIAWEEVADAIRYGWEEQRDPEAHRVHHGPYEDYRQGFEAHHAEMLANSGVSFTDYESAYRRGYDVALDPTYTDLVWEEMEPELRSYYENEYAEGEIPWDNYRDAAYHAWYNVRYMGV